MTLILGIETSCDETAAAVVRDGVEILGQRVASQVDIHARFGGVIPEVASRSHLEVMFPVIEDALSEAGVALTDCDALAVTVEPGLVGCLLVGLSAAKGLSLATGLPIVPVNHVHAHIQGALMPWMAERRRQATAAGGAAGTARAGGAGGAAGTARAGGAGGAGGMGGMGEAIEEACEPPWPIASLVVSGGHTSLYASRGPATHERVGRTIDDAAGEAYDKVAAVLGLGYPGGPVIDKLARDGRAEAYDFPRSFPGERESLDFSFSGLKTAVLFAVRGPNARRGAPNLPGIDGADVAASFQAAVVDVLVGRLVACAERIGARGLSISGGVAANSALRARAAGAAASLDLPLFLPPMALATDNAVMIAGLGYWLFRDGCVGDLALDVSARSG
jgi:N6-L-threonylcarbamoyladenine synthase